MKFIAIAYQGDGFRRVGTSISRKEVQGDWSAVGVNGVGSEGFSRLFGLEYLYAGLGFKVTICLSAAIEVHYDSDRYSHLVP
jgi:hypothetical protein